MAAQIENSAPSGSNASILSIASETHVPMLIRYLQRFYENLSLPIRVSSRD